MLKILKNFIIAILVIGLTLFWSDKTSLAEDLTSRLKGRILLQTESRGEAWYVNPVNLQRYYLGRPADAFAIMRQLGLGISNADFDALSKNMPKRLMGRILIKTGDAGKAFYVYPADSRLHYLGRPADAFAIMRQLGLGISNADLSKITTNPNSNNLLFGQMEQEIHNLINQERVSHGLSSLKWNDEVANVARKHSVDQASQNQELINPNKLCSYPFIHHEGMDFGIYHSQRLNSQGIYYFGASAENIALIPQIKEAQYQTFSNDQPIDCQTQLNNLNESFEIAVKKLPTDAEKINLLRQELANRKNLTQQMRDINLTNIIYNNFNEIDKQAVNGWMNSPGHRQNILNSDYDEAGIGIAQIKDYFIITQVFIKKASCGFKNGSCCQKPGYYPYCYVPFSCNDNICR